MEMLLTIGQPLPLIVFVTEEWLLADCTYKMLNMPLLAQSSDHPFLNRPMACPANWYSHQIMASKAIECAAHFPGIIRQLIATSFAIEMVRME